MFRDVTQKKQKLSREECIALLGIQPRGVLAVQGDGGYPYAVPHNHWYDPQSGNLYFHSGIHGHKVDAVKACDKVSYCVVSEGMPVQGDWALRYHSVIVFGRLRIVEDHDRALEITRRLSLQFTDDVEYIDHEIKTAGDHTLVLELVPEHMTGKSVLEK
jgi:nitroimidazol reductase NimA-like FMN-containing flavoprotein (pyridoxamine 5'-phosphate oxidase superfamily)